MDLADWTSINLTDSGRAGEPRPQDSGYLWQQVEACGRLNTNSRRLAVFQVWPQPYKGKVSSSSGRLILFVTMCVCVVVSACVCMGGPVLIGDT